MASAVANAVNKGIVHTFPTAVGLLVDKSGSMAGYKEVVERSLTQLVKDQQKMKGASASLLLSEFSAEYNKVLDKDFQQIDADHFYEFKAESSTCLYESIERITTEMEDKLANMEKKPKKVVIGIITDGAEACYYKADYMELMNSQSAGAGSMGKSMEERKLEHAKQIIENKRKEGWEYIFFGSFNAEEYARQLGIPKELAATFNNNFSGSFKLISDKITEARKGKTLMITDSEKAKLALPSGREQRDL
jgi:hypothetical protein